MGRWIRWAAGAFFVLVCTGFVIIRSAGHDPDVWHVDPTNTTRTGKPNDALAAPVGTTRAEPDIVLTLLQKPARELLASLDAVARTEPRVKVLAGSTESGRITYVQRSAIIGFPDYVSVTAVETEAGSALILWSRARYGYSDLGVNQARLQRWLAAAGLL
jgi:uncharacterized protein (DUF1499 family)